MRIVILMWCLTGLLIGDVEAKKKTTNWQQSKVAIEVDIKDLAEQVRLGVTIFGDFKSAEQASGYNMPRYVTGHFEQVFNELGITYELVERKKPSEAVLSGLKKKAQRKLYKKMYEDHLLRLKTEGFTDLLMVKFFQQSVTHQRLGMPKINGFGLYKIPGSNCVYHTLGYIHQNLRGRGKSSLHNVVEEIPENKKMDHFCVFGRNIKPLGIEWKKSAADYSVDEVNVIEKELKNLVLKGLLDTFQGQGIIDSQHKANQLYISLTKDDYLVVEKRGVDNFSINDKTYNRIELTQYLQQFSKENSQGKVLVGLETKSAYTFGDLKELFIPIFEGTSFLLYRLGPSYELIEI